MNIREYLKVKEGHTWRPEDTVWVLDKLRLIAAELVDETQRQAYLDARWRENAEWNAQARAEWEAR